MEQRPDVPRWLILLLVGVFAGLAAAAGVLGARSDDDQPDDLDVATSSAPEATIPGTAPEEQTIVLRLTAPGDGCWTRTITDQPNVDGKVAEGCGSVSFPVRVRNWVDISFERRPPASWTWCLVGTVDGRIVLTRGPDSNPEYSLDVYWAPQAVLPPAVPAVSCGGE
jgi:hypothetical protein